MARQSINLAKVKALLSSAVRGDAEAMKTILAPFVGQGEELLDFGVSAKFGILISTYNFYFLTNTRVGDLQVTPLTGALNVEVAFVDSIDAYALIQPHVPLLFRLFMLVLYVFLIGFVLCPALKRAYLRAKKSGVFLKLAGAALGTLIFADRDKLVVMSRLCDQIGDLRNAARR